MVPDGDYSIEDCAQVSTRIFKEVFRVCDIYGVGFDGCLFKPHMIKEGSSCKDKASLADVAKHTVEVFKNTLPKDLGGVFFLSGG